MIIPTVHIDPLGTKRTVRPYMGLGEQEVLLGLVKTIQPRVMIEVGVNIGLTAQAMLKHIPTIQRYYGIDVDQDYKFEIQAQTIERPKAPGELVKGDPRFLLCLRGRDTLPTSADVVFIDGDHGHQAALKDSRWAYGVTRRGGMIVWHDYKNPTVQVTGVLNELHAEGHELYHVADTWLVYERR